MSELGSHQETAREPSLRETQMFCERVSGAAELMHTAVELMKQANRQSSKMGLESYNSLYTFRVCLPENAEAFVENDDFDIIDENPQEFVATGVRSLDIHGVEFQDNNTGNILHLRGHQFEIYAVEPGQ